LEKGFDVVIGNPKNQQASLSLFSRLFLSMVTAFSRQGYFYRSNHSLALNRRAVLSITRTRRKNRNFTYLNSLIGLKRQIISYEGLSNQSANDPRTGLFTILKVVLDDVISNSFKPIRWISLLGMLGSTLFLLYILGVVILIIVFQMTWIAPQGWISLATVMGALFFLLFSLLTIMSEYLIRIMDESRNEPLYFISQEKDGSHRIFKNRQKSLQKKLNIIKI
jgi:dolichol-phosphate mannosyltransferase